MWTPWRSERRSPPPEPSAAGGLRSGSYGEILTHEQLGALAAELTDSERRHIVVGVTSIPHANVPSVDIHTLRLILPSDARVYFIPSGSLTFRLMNLLPDRRAPFNGAVKIWMPGEEWGQDRFRHPQIYDDANEYGLRAIREIAYKLSHALTRSGLQVDVDPVKAFGTLELVRAQAELEQLQGALARAIDERDRTRERLRVSEGRELEARRELATLRTRVLGPLVAAGQSHEDGHGVTRDEHRRLTPQTGLESK